MSNLDELKAALDAAERDERAAAERTRAARHAHKAAMFAAHPIRPGDIVRSATGKLARVIGHELRWGGVQIRAVLQNKDGTFGKREMSNWRPEWENATVHQRAEESVS